MIVSASLAFASPVRMAVVVGSNEGSGPELPLRYAERDAERLAAVLTELGGFDPEDLVLLRGPTADRVTDVLAEMERRAAWATANGDETLLVVYYSGHADADALHLGPTELSLVDLKRAVDQVPVDVRLMMVDACQSGELTRLKGATQAPPFTITAEDHLASEGLVILTASSPGEDAQESDRLGGGVFTHHLLAALSGAADESGDGEVTLTEAWRYGYAGTVRSTSEAPFVQHPTFAFDLTGRADLVLTRLDAGERSGLVSFAEGGTWMLLPTDDHGDVLELTVPPGAQVAVDPGDWLVRRREQSVLLEGRIQVERGELVALARSELAVVPYGTTVRRGLVEDRRAAFAVSAGLGIVGPTLPGLPTAPEGTLGARLDLEPLSLGLRLHGGWVRSENDAVVMHQDRLGVDLSLVKWLEGPGVHPNRLRFVPGLGVRAGADLVSQRFESDGIAPDNLGATGRLGPWLGADLWLGARSTLSLSGGADVSVYRTIGGELAASPLPQVSLEGVVYVR